VTLYLYYPGFMAWDSTEQFAQVMSGRILNWHPPIMVYLWRLTNAVIFGPGGMLILHAAAYWTGLVLIAAAALRRPLPRVALVLVLGFFPPVFGLLGTVFKDSGMTAFLLLAVGLTLADRDAIREAEAGGRRPNPLVVGAALACAFYAAAVRVTGLLGVVPILWLLAGRRGGSGRRRAAVSGALTLVFAGGIAGFHALGATPMPYRAAVPLWDLAMVSLASGRVLIPEEAVRGGRLDLAGLRRITQPWRCSFHDPHGALEVSFHFLDPAGANRVTEQWLRAIRQHPGPYFDHRARVTRRLMVDPEPKLVHRMWSIPSQEVPVEFHARPGFPSVHRALAAAGRSLLYQPWIYLLGALVAVLGALRLAGPPASVVRSLAASGVLSVAPLPVIAPSIDLRYSIWLIVATLLSLALLRSRA
jgi:hypothetical protein